MEDDLAQQLAATHRSGRHDVDPAPFAALDREAVYLVQTNTLKLLGESVGALKVGIDAAGVAVVAPIFGSNVGASGALRLPAGNFIGLEVEVAVVLGSDLPPDVAAQGDDTMRVAIDHYVMGIEIIGTRFSDRSAAGYEGGLSDNMSGLGYAVGGASWTRGADIDGLAVKIDWNGKTIYNSPARHSFGTVLNSFFAYARNPRPEFPLTKGLLVTTGSLCGLVPVTGPGHAVAYMDDQTVEVDIVAG